MALPPGDDKVPSPDQKTIRGRQGLIPGSENHPERIRSHPRIINPSIHIYLSYRNMAPASARIADLLGGGTRDGRGGLHDGSSSRRGLHGFGGVCGGELGAHGGRGLTCCDPKRFSPYALVCVEKRPGLPPVSSWIVSFCCLASLRIIPQGDTRDACCGDLL